jgi:hypothetical protein
MPITIDAEPAGANSRGKVAGWVVVAAHKFPASSQSPVGRNNLYSDRLLGRHDLVFEAVFLALSIQHAEQIR